MNVVWLKRDVRLIDHEPLSLAVSQPEHMILLYVYEDCHLGSDVYHEAHHQFINEGLADLDAKVRAIADSGIVFRRGSAVDALAALHATVPIRALFSHSEVGNAISRSRDAEVAAWATAQGVRWTRCRQDGVSDVRHADLGEGSWAARWAGAMGAPQAPAPTRLRLVPADRIDPGTLLDARACAVRHFIRILPAANQYFVQHLFNSAYRYKTLLVQV